MRYATLLVTAVASGETRREICRHDRRAGPPVQRRRAERVARRATVPAIRAQERRIRSAAARCMARRGSAARRQSHRYKRRLLEPSPADRICQPSASNAFARASARTRAGPTCRTVLQDAARPGVSEHTTTTRGINRAHEHGRRTTPAGYRGHHLLSAKAWPTGPRIWTSGSSIPLRPSRPAGPAQRGRALLEALEQPEIRAR